MYNRERFEEYSSIISSSLLYSILNCFIDIVLKRNAYAIKLEFHSVHFFYLPRFYPFKGFATLDLKQNTHHLLFGGPPKKEDMEFLLILIKYFRSYGLKYCYLRYIQCLLGNIYFLFVWFLNWFSNWFLNWFLNWFSNWFLNWCLLQSFRIYVVVHTFQSTM